VAAEELELLTVTVTVGKVRARVSTKGPGLLALDVNRKLPQAQRREGHSAGIGADARRNSCTYCSPRELNAFQWRIGLRRVPNRALKLTIGGTDGRGESKA
jgi:hypothetical protein